MSRRSFLATASAIAPNLRCPLLWSIVVRGAVGFPGIRFFPGVGVGERRHMERGLLRGGLLQPVQYPTRGHVVRLRSVLLVLAEKKFEWKKLLADETKASGVARAGPGPTWSN